MSKPAKATSRADRLLAQFHEEAPAPNKSLDLELLRLLWPFARPHRVLYLTALCLIPIGTLTALFLPRLLQRAVDSVDVGAPLEALRDIAWAYGGLITLRFAAGAVETYLMQLAGQRTLADLRLAAFNHLPKLAIRYFDRVPVGRIVTRVTNDIDSMSELFAAGAITAIADVVLLVGIVVAMVTLDPWLSLAAFVVAPPLVLLVEMFRRVLRAAQRRIRLRTAELNAFMNEQVQGMQVVQAFSREAECQAAYAEINGDYRAAYRRSISADAMLYSTVEAISSICVGLVLYYAADQLSGATGAEAELQKGTFVAFYAYIQQFFVPVRDLSSKYTVIQTALASAERVFGLLSVNEWDAPSAGPAAAGPLDGAPAIAFEDVWFRYKPDAEPALKGVSFEVRAGETVALVGATGAGKSTIASLALRFYEIERGAVRVQGTDARALSADSLRRRFAVVPQDVFLFSGDLLSNVTFGAPVRDPERARAVLTQVAAWEVFAPRGGLSLQIAERGANLSAGERQLIAFARALYLDRPLLMLDEATANIDSETEARLSTAVTSLLEGRSAIVVAHRLSTIRQADRIIVLHHGRVVEQGDHRELLALGGVYARLYRLQMSAEPRTLTSA